MSQLVRLEGKHTWQNAHCAMVYPGHDNYDDIWPTIFPLAKPCSWKHIICCKIETHFRCLFSTKYFVTQTQVCSKTMDQRLSRLPFNFQISISDFKISLTFLVFNKKDDTYSPLCESLSANNNQFRKPTIFWSQQDPV